ncbi:MAG: hypothetical protein HKN17_00540 [Rhodothermales bacterium]|nr:hypothetical protein [Rhodothermales bacterium]
MPRSHRSVLIVVCMTLIGFSGCVSTDEPSQPSPPPAATPGDGGVDIVIHTEAGDIAVRIDTAAAPGTAANFLRYVDDGLYDGGTFFRVVRMDNQPDDSIRIEVIQGGADADRSDEFHEAIRLETTEMTHLSHVDGTISMARGGPHTATHSFFITIGDQPELDFGGRRNPDGQGFAAFGSVTEGMDVVRAIQTGTTDGQRLTDPVAIRSVRRKGRVRRAGFVVTPGVYNSELMAPYDIFHHTIFRDDTAYIEPFVVSADGGPIMTFEGLTVDAHHSFESAPPIDILVIPSTVGSMDRDLGDEAFMTWLARAVDRAEWVVTLCDGSFPLAATGRLAGRTATTFPGDRDRFAEMFPEIEVRRDARFVVDGKFVTSVGGAMSYEPALWLVEHLYGRESAELTAEGMVWDWNPESVPHVVVE